MTQREDPRKSAPSAHGASAPATDKVLNVDFTPPAPDTAARELLGQAMIIGREKLRGAGKTPNEIAASVRPLAKELGAALAEFAHTGALPNKYRSVFGDGHAHPLASSEFMLVTINGRVHCGARLGPDTPISPREIFDPKFGVDAAYIFTGQGIWRLYPEANRSSARVTSPSGMEFRLDDGMMQSPLNITLIYAGLPDNTPCLGIVIDQGKAPYNGTAMKLGAPVPHEIIVDPDRS